MLFKLSLVVLGGPFEPVAVAKGLLLVATPLPLVATLLAIKPVRGGLAWAVAAPVVGLVLAAISLFFDPPDWIPGLLLAGGFAISLRTVWPHLRGGSRAPESMARTPGEATATLRKDTLSGIARAALQATLLVPLSWILAAQITALTADAPDAVTVLAILLPVGAILAPTLRPLNRSLDTWMPQGTAAPFELLPLPTGALRRAISAHILTLTVVTIELTLASVQLLTALNMHSDDILDLAGGVLKLTPLIGSAIAVSISRGWGPPSASRSAAMAASLIPALMFASWAGPALGIPTDRADVGGLMGAAVGGALLVAIAAIIRWPKPR